MKMNARVAAALAPALLVSVMAGAGGPAARQSGGRRLIIHADDLGMSHSVNRATFEALEHGWVTSASILVPCPWFPEVARWAVSHPEADLGIHLAVNSEWTPFRWAPVSGRAAVPSLVDAQGYMALEETEVVRRAIPAEVDRELRAQIDFARAAGVRPTHLDSHMATLFQTEQLFAVYRGLAKAYGLPQLLERLGARGGQQAPAWAASASADARIDRILGIDPGVPADQWLGAYEKMLAPLPPGTYQLIVHLAYDDEEMRGATADHPNWGAAWRQSDFDMVKSAAFADFLKQQGFTLVTWREVGR
ncbi:MAG TPA: polysaccharide deacetylase family protein [Vicinamibacterales bacterium]|nr:polysaccharide deacetylase family protein [Vicinamibacterales bacterium]